MKIPLIGDLHIGARGSDPHVREFIKDYLSNFFEYLAEHDLNTYIQAGDICDVRKAINAHDMDFIMNDFVDFHLEYGISGHILTGNHDIALRDSNKISWTKVIERMSMDFIKSYQEPTDVEINGVKFCMIPWINKDNYERTIAHIASTDAKYAIAHLELAGFPMYRNSISEEGQIELSTLKKFKHVFSGHYHTISQSGNITYIGTPYHLTWQDYPDKRGFWILDTDTDEVEFVQNSDDKTLFKLFIYDWKNIENNNEMMLKLKEPHCLENDFGFKNRIVQVIVMNRDNTRHYNDFCNALRASQTIDYMTIDKTVQETTSSESEGSSESVDVSEETLHTDILEVLTTRIQKSEANIDKPKTITMMQEIHSTAMNMEKLS
jgi:DNA repair exonuclease SbcCD nuclease subunit